MSNKQGNKTMMMVGLAAVCCLSVMSVAGGAMVYLNDEKSTTAPPTVPVVTPDDDDTSAASGDLGGLRKIKYGKVSMVVPSSGGCGNKQKPYFENTQENDQHLWNFDPVAGKDGVYYIRSEQKMFKKACPMYLTAPSSCASNSEATLEKTQYADRQYWKAVPSGNGYQLVSVHCQNARGHPFLISKGSTSGKSNTARMANRTGSTYTIESTA